MGRMPAPSPTAIDLSRLPAPGVVETLALEEIVRARMADLVARLPGFDAFLVSDPAVKLQQVDAYRELLVRAAINDAARSVMLAFARGADLDHIAIRFGVVRRQVSPDGALEGDDEFRLRVQLAPEAWAQAGLTGGGYRARALAIAPQVKDVAAIKRDGGRVDVVLLGRAGDGSVSAETIDTVYRAFQAEDATQLTDIVTVRSAAIVPYAPRLTLQIRPGPDPQVVHAAAEAAVRVYAASRHRVGQIVYAQALTAAACVGPVEQALVDIPDVDPGAAGAAWLSDLAIAVEVIA